MRSPKARIRCADDLAEPVALPLEACLAKTRFADNLTRAGGRTVFDHCCIVGEVARMLIERMSPLLRDSLFPSGSSLIAATHDIGKVSPTFQEKIHRGIDGYVPNSLSGLAEAEPSLERGWGGHAGTSMVSMQALDSGKFIPEILGRHHGFPPSIAGQMANDKNFLADQCGNRDGLNWLITSRVNYSWSFLL